MHLIYALGIAENFEFEWFHNVIANILHVVLVDTPMLPPYTLPQLEPQLPLEVNALIPRKVIMSIITRGIHLCLSPEVFCG